MGVATDQKTRELSCLCALLCVETSDLVEVPRLDVPCDASASFEEYRDENADCLVRHEYSFGGYSVWCGRPGIVRKDTNSNDIRDGGKSIPYDEEDPFIRQDYETTLKNPVTETRMAEWLCHKPKDGEIRPSIESIGDCAFRIQLPAASFAFARISGV